MSSQSVVDDDAWVAKLNGYIQLPPKAYRSLQKGDHVRYVVVKDGVRARRTGGWIENSGARAITDQETGQKVDTLTFINKVPWAPPRALAGGDTARWSVPIDGRLLEVWVKMTAKEIAMFNYIQIHHQAITASAARPPSA